MFHTSVTGVFNTRVRAPTRANKKQLSHTQRLALGDRGNSVVEHLSRELRLQFHAIERRGCFDDSNLSPFETAIGFDERATDVDLVRCSNRRVVQVVTLYIRKRQESAD